MNNGSIAPVNPATGKVDAGEARRNPYDRPQKILNPYDRPTPIHASGKPGEYSTQSINAFPSTSVNTQTVRKDDAPEVASSTVSQGSDTQNITKDDASMPTMNRVRRVLSPPPDYKLLPRSSISPTHSTVYIQECEAAAVASRLPPNHMSAQETSVMRQHLSHLQVTSYVVMRNAILRLWIKNPMIWVSREEAQGVAREERHFPLCREIWEFLMRRGYINHGCLDVPDVPTTTRETKVILILGAGIAGLAAARQLQALFAAFHDRLEFNYKVKIIEARSRIGGRVYSHDLTKTNRHPRARVDLGAQIVTGFAGGNPLNTVIKRQLSHPCQSLVQARNNKIHDADGQAISTEQDLRVEGLFNLLLDVAARFRDAPQSLQLRPESIVKNAEDLGPENPEKTHEQDTASQGNETQNSKIQSNGHASHAENNDEQSEFPADQATSEITNMTQIMSSLRTLGYQVSQDSFLPSIEEASSLGKTMTNILDGLQTVTDISDSDKSVLNWHWANMEYACGTNLDNLSLRHWDQDDGNEFRGHHAMIIGGYSSLARGLALAPSKLDIQLESPVSRVKWDSIELKSGTNIQASKIIITLPLGVLKTGAVEFSPMLPDSKLAAIDKLGFGLLNKVVLVYDEQFWNAEVDLLGALPIVENDKDSARGRFYMFWNCTSHASGQPVLVALMAGDAAVASEAMSDADLVHEATNILQGIHRDIKIPQPREYIVTRWGKDPYSLGSYSYIGQAGSGADYEALARPVGNHWFFGGEATCQTHPSTVHGAYLSGLAVANDVIESIIGAQEISADVPLVPIKSRPQTAEHPAQESGSKKRKFDTLADTSSLPVKKQLQLLQSQRETLEQERLHTLIAERLGVRPEEPKRVNANPFLIYQKDQWDACRLMADAAQQQKQNDPTAKATKNQVRSCLGQTWRDKPEAEKQTWTDIVKQKKAEHEVVKAEWQAQVAEWDKKHSDLLQEFETVIRPQFVTEAEKTLLSAQSAPATGSGAATD